MQQYLDERITGEDFDLEEMLAEVAGDAVDERKQKLKWQIRLVELLRSR